MIPPKIQRQECASEIMRRPCCPQGLRLGYSVAGGYSSPRGAHLRQQHYALKGFAHSLAPLG